MGQKGDTLEREKIVSFRPPRLKLPCASTNSGQFFYREAIFFYREAIFFIFIINTLFVF